MNTLKFGNGEWYGKKDTILAYNDENSNFKPLPFSFDRASFATRVNKDGLIETVGSGEPRIDFLNDSNGALLLEPTRTNLTLYSEDLSNSYWAKQNGSIISNVISSPNGLVNADLFTENTSNGDHAMFDIVSYFVSGTTYTTSFFAKSNGRTKVELASANSGTCPTARFDLEEKTATATNNSFGAKIEDYGNGWFRCSVSRVAPNSGIDLPYYATVINFGVIGYAGDGASGMYFWGMQTEAGSYATSYIPTQGVTTRVAEVCSQTPPSGIIGQTEGTILLDFNINNLENQTNEPIVLSFNSSNYIQIFGNGRVNYYDGTGNIDINLPSYGLTSGGHKFGIAYNINDVAFYIDGTLAGTDTSCSPSSKSSLYLGYTNINFLPFISYNEVKLYNTRLSNAELQALTSN